MLFLAISCWLLGSSYWLSAYKKNSNFAAFTIIPYFHELQSRT